MPKKAMEVLTESMFYVLLAFQGGPLCGAEVMAAVDRVTGGRVKLGPATLYTILGKFEREHYLRELESDGRRRTYELTERGLEAYRAELRRLSQCLQDAGVLEGGAVYREKPDFLSPATLPGL